MKTRKPDHKLDHKPDQKLDHKLDRKPDHKLDHELNQKPDHKIGNKIVNKAIVHKVIVEKIILALCEILLEQRQADKVIDRLMKANKKWGARDRKFFAECVYEIVRWYKKYLYLYNPKCADSDLELFASTNEKVLWQIWGSYFVEKYGELPAWPELENVIKPSSSIYEKAPLAVQQSIPCWIHALGEAQFKSEWPELLRSLNQPADVYLRVNEMQISKKELQSRLASLDIATEFVPGVESALKLKERKNVFVTELFKQGLFEVQDAASQMIAPLMQLAPGARVVDACAGAGGKTLHIATMLKNKGKVLALDIYEWKLQELKARARRQKIDVIETRWIENSKTMKRLQDSCDRLLLDVPCSGFGVLKRQPDKKWKLSLEEIERLQTLQREILTNYSKCVRKGGLLVYATCSLLPGENEDQVRWFLSQNENFEKKSEHFIWPHKTGFDGFYASVLERKN